MLATLVVLFFDFSFDSTINLLVPLLLSTQTTVCKLAITGQSHFKQSCRSPLLPSNGIFSLFSHSSKGTSTTGYFEEKICSLPLNFFVKKNMTAIGLHFSSDGDLSLGTGFMAGYATYVEGTISSDYHYNSCHKVTYTYRQAGLGCMQWCNSPLMTSKRMWSNNLGKSHTNVICYKINSTIG